MFKLWRDILKLAVPSVATFSSMTLTGMITLILVGHLGATAIAAVGISNILMYNAWALFAGLNESVNFLVAQNYGEQNMSQANERTQVALIASAAISVLVLLLSFILPHWIFVWMGTRHAVTLEGGDYLKIRFLAFCFTILTNVFVAYMRGVGDTKTPMYIALLTNVLLVLLTYVLTYGVFSFRGYGLSGAGWSMFITEFLGCALSAWVVYRVYHPKFDTRRWHPIGHGEMKLVLWESGKLSAMEVSMSAGMLVFTACIAQLGTVAIAANEIALNILSLGFMPANGFGMAATTLVGQEVGASRSLHAKRVGLHTVLLGVMFMALFSVFLWIFALPVAKVYTGNSDVFSLAARLIDIAAFVQIFDGTGIIVGGGLRGVGDTTFLFRVSLLTTWGVFVPFTLLFTIVFHWGQVGAWLALSLLIVMLGLANLTRFLRLQWTLLQTRSVRV